MSLQPPKKYWEQEQPIEFRRGNSIAKYYPKAKQLQFFNWIESPTYQGYSKGVTFNMLEWKPGDIDAFIKFSGGIGGVQ